MQLFLHLLCGFIIFNVVNAFVLSQEDQCIVNIRKEIKERNVSRNVGGIVGIGWDDLTNKATLPIFPIDYKQCKSTPDGDFLVPDNVVVFPIKESNIQKSTATYDSYSSYKSDFGMSLEAEVGGGIPGIGTVSGSFSADVKIGKTHMEKNKQSCFSNKVEYRAFTLVGTENTGFHPSFSARLYEIADAIKDKKWMLAQYNTEALIGDYGTHVINKAVAGASITMNTFISVTEGVDTSQISANLSIGFETNIMGGLVSAKVKASAHVGLGLESGSTNTTSQTYILTQGGPDVNRLFGKTEDGNKISIDSVVGLNKEGTLLYNLIHPGSVKNYDKKTVRILQDLIYNATIEYYTQNIIPGNTDSSALNYFYKANVDDKVPFASLTFKNFPGSAFNGGFFQKCEYISSFSEIYDSVPQGNACEQFNNPNYVFDSTYSCPAGFLETMLQPFYVTLNERSHSDPNCTNCSYPITDEIAVTPYWCEYNKMATQHVDPVKFGGMFSSNNVFSDNGRCPGGFNEYPFHKNLKICLGKHYGKIEENSGIVAFGGMPDCKKPYESCPYGYSKYLAATYEGCSYYYCAAIMPGFNQTTLQSIRKPPFIDRKAVMSETQFSFRQKTQPSNYNGTNFHGAVFNNF